MADENTAIMDEVSTASAPVRLEEPKESEGQEHEFLRRIVRLRQPNSVFLIDLIGSTDSDSVINGTFRVLMGGMEVPTGGDAYRVIRAIRPTTETVMPFYTPGEIVSIIRAALSLNITEVAKALQVKRPTIYAWISDQAEPQGHNLRRLNELLGIARHWMRLSNKPLGVFVRQADRTGHSLVDILSNEPIDQEDVFRRLSALHRKLTVVSRQRKSVRESALKHGMDISQLKDQQDAIDWLTGKRPE